ncbi:MAG TPA: CDP-alcohol phosphatidyltransferase family protein [Anaerolineales bacterium]|nr:CDP-alcohol phosphatidyltransferase family protein [Anaerolineales bacterium]
MFERLPLPARVTLAWSVHLFTATGAIWGFLTLIAIFEQNWRLTILWMIVAMFVDGFDGMLARWFHVKEYAAGVDGGLMDNIIDYLNYVVVAAFILITVPNLMPAGFALPAAFSILLTSAYQFSQVDAKSDEQTYFFKGFPSLWNFLVLYMMLIGLNPWINLLALIVCNILIFVPIKYIYPSRNTRLRRLTLGLTYLYGVIGVWGLLQYPDVPQWVVWVSLLYVAYYAMLSIFPRIGGAKLA